ARMPEIKGRDAFWFAKKSGKSLYTGEYSDIHMPNNSGQPFILGAIFMFFGFFMVFSWWVGAVIGALGIFIMMIVRSFERDHGHYIPAKEVVATEQRLRGEQV